MFRALKRRSLTRREWDELMYYLKMSNTSTVRRAGYALDCIAPAWFTKELNKLSDVKGGVSFFQSTRNEGFSRKWRIYGGFNITRWKNAQ
jgi:predicted transcriptional regulator of viral defense system